MSGRLQQLVWLVLLGINLLRPSIASGLQIPDVPPGTDVRVLIDVSDSMQAHDPANLRVPAFRMIVRMLPDGVRAGVWVYGSYANMLVPLGEVDSEWRSLAVAALHGVDSVATYSNLEQGLDGAAWGWKPSDGPSRRSLILLSGGPVHVSADGKADNASRERITTEILPRLQDARVEVHTIFFSAGADAQLMQRLSRETGGISARIESMEDLHTVLLRLLDQAVAPAVLPVTDMQFSVAEGVAEIDVLALRDKAGHPARLVTPDGRNIGSTSTMPGMIWQSADHFDLVSIHKPRAGVWKLSADADASHRVAVHSDGEVVLAGLPHEISAGEELPVTVTVYRQGRVMNARNRSGELAVRLLDDSGDGETMEWVLNDAGQDGDVRAGDGQYTTLYGKQLHPGDHQVVVRVEGESMHREIRQEVRVAEAPVTATVSRYLAGSGAGYRVDLQIAESVDPDSVNLRAFLLPEGGNPDEIAVYRRGARHWILDIPEFPDDARYAVTGRLQATNRWGRQIGFVIDPVPLGGSASAGGDLPDGHVAGGISQGKLTGESPVWVESKGEYAVFGAIQFILLTVAVAMLIFWRRLGRVPELALS